MLKAFAPPAASVPPTTVATMSQIGGIPFAATIMVGTVVTSRSSMIRGLVSATYAATVCRNDVRDAAASVTIDPHPTEPPRAGPEPR